MLNADRDEVFISELAMKVPENIMATRLFDTTQLKVDYDKLSPVAQTLVAPPFLMGTLTEDKDQQAEVLVIGLGGSQINNFIHHKYPKVHFLNLNMTVIELEQSMVDIAKEYFGLKVDDTQHVFVMDGIKYLEDAAKQGRKFDAIYIDVCPTRFPEGIMIMCPIPPLLEDEVIRHIRQCLKDTGIILNYLNILPSFL
ncbi:unnamed protein product [Anisakis simplex]|uniref:PABS domain-containing protein n=1 Tax=Anisakis simplex TaxID=6269 RepID=A0A0M3K8M8_ANISI|nr:unnamed protein product [Anisakis simplex]